MDERHFSTKTLACFLAKVILAIIAYSQVNHPLNWTDNAQFQEQTGEMHIPADVRILINRPITMPTHKPTLIALYTLPNGNSIECTVGKQMRPGDDWHYDIQHIGAQTRWLREIVKDKNLIVVYLQTDGKSWPAWRQAHPDNAVLIQAIVDTIRNLFAEYNPAIILTGHSGGGSFTFGFLNGVNTIPAYVKRIAFLDSNYGYESELRHAEKLANWLRNNNDTYLSVLAYDDSNVLYEGKPIVSPTGGTWYRSHLMQHDLASYFSFQENHDEQFERYRALNGRIQFLLKRNPDRLIWHTVQVERNGFIQSLLSGTQYEGKGYIYFGERVYQPFIRSE